MENDLTERVVRLEVLAAEKQERTEAQFNELKKELRRSEDKLYATLRKHDDDQAILINQILKDISSIASEATRYKGMIGGVILAVSAIWFVLTQVANWLHIDFIKMIGSAIGK